MKSLCFEGQMLIDFEKIRRFINKDSSLQLLKQSINLLLNNHLEDALKNISIVKDLVTESINLSFLAVEGHKAFLFNEKEDRVNYWKLNSVSIKLLRLYAYLPTLKIEDTHIPNLIDNYTFLIRKSIQNITDIMAELTNTE